MYFPYRGWFVSEFMVGIIYSTRQDFSVVLQKDAKNSRPCPHPTSRGGHVGGGTCKLRLLLVYKDRYGQTRLDLRTKLSFLRSL